MTNQEINRAVALAMGWHLTHGNAGRRPGAHKLDASEILPRFCTDPAAAEILRGFIESLDHGRLWIDERSYPHDFPTRGEQEGQRVRRYSCTIRGSGRETWQESFCETQGSALCLAFLKMRAAHEATDTDKDRAGDGPT